MSLLFALAMAAQAAEPAAPAAPPPAAPPPVMPSAFLGEWALQRCAVTNMRAAF